MKMSMKQICKELRKNSAKINKSAPTVKTSSSTKKESFFGRGNCYLSAMPDMHSAFYKVNRDHGNNIALLAGMAQLIK